jgi:hypothetical protein
LTGSEFCKKVFLKLICATIPRKIFWFCGGGIAQVRRMCFADVRLGDAQDVDPLLLRGGCEGFSMFECEPSVFHFGVSLMSHENVTAKPCPRCLPK